MTAHAEGRFVGPRRPLRVLAAEDVEHIHEASLDVLPGTGVMFHSQGALDVLEAHGAVVDRGATIARIPRATVTEAQSAYENTLGMVLEMAAAADFLFGAGLLDSVQQMSLEKLVSADEVFGMVTRLIRGVSVDRETLAVDLIEKLGLEGDYLSGPHARAHVRELWQARLGETGAYDGWQGAGSPRLEDKARAVADGILATPAPEFPEELDREFIEIIAAAQSGRI